MMLRKGFANILIDGQFGSTGKGVMAGYIGAHHKIDIAVTNASANAGHTCHDVPGFKDPVVLNHLPMSALFQPDCGIYLNAGAIIDPDKLMEEIDTYKVDLGRVAIHPRAAVIHPDDRFREEKLDSTATSIGSTRHGVGEALIGKIRRSGVLAGETRRLKEFIDVADLNEFCRLGATVFIEVPQGFSLGINSGLAYPYCTSREISVSQALSDAQIHPQYLGSVTMTMRTFPIRVGNIYNEKGEEIGWSGPWYPDQDETTWGAIGVKPELTTVTKRPRRVATFSMLQYKAAVDLLRPDYVFCNFMNYLPDDMSGTRVKFLTRCDEVQRVTHVGLGPSWRNIHNV